jgi:nicotinate phosphoribosyltransferase
VDSTGLLTDHYELTMVEAALRSGTAHRRSVFEVFARRLPDGRRYGVVAGTGRLLDAVESFRFEPAQLDWLSDHEIVDQATLDWLAGYRFSGTVVGYGEGDSYFAGSPVVTVESSFAEGVVLETLILSILNHDAAIASAASRMTRAAEGRPIIEMGSRRTHEQAAVAAARAAYVAGFEFTSNLQAGVDFGVPTRGTAAHSFTLLHDTERDAFTAQVESLGKATTLLVDTYDVVDAVRTAVEIAGTDLGAIRIDSGDLPLLAKQVRHQLDQLGATKTRIIVSGDLDEYSMASLTGAPVDAYGVGTSLVTGSGFPTCGFVYKLVARGSTNQPDSPLVAVAKQSSAKISMGGRKWALRRRDARGVAVAEVIGVGAMSEHRGPSDRELVVPLIHDGEVVGREPLRTARERHDRAMAELPVEAGRLSHGEPAIDTEFVGSTFVGSTR